MHFSNSFSHTDRKEKRVARIVEKDFVLEDKVKLRIILNLVCKGGEEDGYLRNAHNSD
jgi:hypothetical protein